MIETEISINPVDTAIEQAQETAKRNHINSLRIVDQDGTTVFRARAAAILGKTFIAFNGQQGCFFLTRTHRIMPDNPDDFDKIVFSELAEKRFFGEG